MDSSDDVERRRGGKSSSDDLVLVEDGAGRSVNLAPSSSGAGRGRAKKTRNGVESPI